MIQAKKTNAPSIGVTPSRNNRNATVSWFISVRYYGTKGQKGVDRKVYGYPTKHEAVSDSAHYRHYLDSPRI